VVPAAIDRQADRADAELARSVAVLEHVGLELVDLLLEVDERAPRRVPGAAKGATLLLLQQASLTARFQKGAATRDSAKDAEANREWIWIDCLNRLELHRPSLASRHTPPKVAFPATAEATARR
jgi:hypothetical protein